MDEAAQVRHAIEWRGSGHHLPGGAADDWVAAHTSPRTLVVTGDVLLAYRAVATRAILADLRVMNKWLACDFLRRMT